MTAFVFVGPSLPRDRIDCTHQVVCLSPARQGDVYRATQAGATAIGLIDGYFEGVPSVWHKEILWALSQGVAVYGSASMGALRAAELDAFGMRGVGRIFAAYRSGALIDDDEVAVQHGPAALGFVALSEPMVNIRATLDRAVAEDVIDRQTHAALVARAKGAFYPERRWEFLLDEADAPVTSCDQLGALRAWLPGGRVDQKAEDAAAMLDEMTAWLEAEEPLDTVSFDFEWTDAWETAIAVPLKQDGDHALHAAGDEAAGVLAGLRLDPEAYGAARTAAVARHLALRDADRMGLRADRPTVRGTMARLRTELGLFHRAALENWMRANGLSDEAMERLIEDEARLDRYLSELGPMLDAPLLDELRLRDAYGDLADRARRKCALLAEAAHPDPDPESLGVPPPLLVKWYFEDRRKQAIPQDLDAHIAALGLPDRKEFYRLLSREYLFLRESARKDDSQ